VKVLVTGGSGFIGRHTLAPLLARGCDVHLLGRSQPKNLPEGVSFHEVDLLTCMNLNERLAEVSAPLLLHLAWDVTHGQFWHAPNNLDWVSASLRLARAFREAGGRRMVAAGTCAEYDWSAAMPCVEAETPCRPHTLYGAAKNATQDVLSRYAQTSECSFAWGRIFLTFGPGEAPKRLIAAVIQQLLRGERVALSPGHQVRDFLCTEDMGRAFVELLLSDVEGPVNIASGQPISLRDLVKIAAKVMGCSEDLLGFGDLPARPDDHAELTADTRRLVSEVGFKPKLSLEEALEQTIVWWKDELNSRV
jgi:nucleoside-diphosphate-sugar epimerase